MVKFTANYADIMTALMTKTPHVCPAYEKDLTEREAGQILLIRKLIPASIV